MVVKIQYTKKGMKGRDSLNGREKAILDALEQDLRETSGKPFGRGWSSLGPLRQYGSDAFHCHMTRNKVAIWRVIEDAGTIRIILCRFEYIGDRGNAPY